MDEGRQLVEEQRRLYEEAHGLQQGSVFYVGQWSVKAADTPRSQERIRELLENYRELGGHHPEIKSLACWRNTFSGEPRWTFRWMEEYDNLHVIEDRPGQWAQIEAWTRTVEFAEPGTYRGGLWRGVHQDAWFNYPERSSLSEPSVSEDDNSGPDEEQDRLYDAAYGTTNGSVFYFGEWTVRFPEVPPTQESIRELLENYRELGGHHPEIKSLACWRNTFSGEPRWTFRWMEEYDNLHVIEDRPGKMAQREAWLRAVEFAEPATRRAGLWKGVHQDLWFNGSD